MTPLRVSVAVVTGDALLAEGLSAWLQLNRPHVQCGHGRNEPDAAALRGALVVLDIDQCPASGTLDEVIGQFLDMGARVIVIGSAASEHRIRQALLAGAKGHVPKDRGCRYLADVIDRVACGEYGAEMSRLTSGLGAPALSVQELCALRLYAQGLPLKTVARQMGISPHTAKEYLDRVRNKYATVGRPARTKTDLARVAREDGWLD